MPEPRPPVGALGQPPARPPAPGAPPLDTLRLVETPEGVDLRLSLAGPLPRATAWVLDALIRGLLYLASTPLLGLAGLGTGLFLLLIFLVEWFYPVWFEVRRGATPGKQALGLAVVHDDGTPVGPAASLLRNLLRTVDFLPLFYLTGLVSMVLDRDFRRLGDLAAGTLVIHAPKSLVRRLLPVRPPRAPGRPLDLITAQAILDFAERCPRLSPERRVELAEVLLAEPRGEAAVEHLLQIANWLTGAADDAPRGG